MDLAFRCMTWGYRNDRYQQASPVGNEVSSVHDTRINNVDTEVLRETGSQCMETAIHHSGFCW